MANSQLIDQIIDQKAFDQINKLEADLVELKESFVQATLAANELNKSVANSNSFKTFSKAASDAAVAQAKVNKLSAETIAIEQKKQKAIELAQEKINQAKIKGADVIARQEARNAAAAEKTMKAEAAKLAVIEAKTKTIISDSQAEVDAYNNAIDGSANLKTALTEEQELNNQVASSLTALGLARGTNTDQIKKENDSIKVNNLTKKQQAFLLAEEKFNLQRSTAELKNQVREQNSAKGSLEQRRAALIRLNTVFDNQSPAERASASGQRLQKVLGGLDEQVKTLEKSTGRSQRNVGNYGNGLTKAYGALTKIANILPGVGIGGLIGFAAEPILNYVLAIDVAFRKVNQLAETKKQLNDVNLKGAQNSQLELVQLKTLYDASQNVTFSLKERNKYIDELQKKYPDYLGNISNEDFAAGKASEAYNRLRLSIIATARARASQDKIAENASRQLEDEQKILDLREEANKRNLSTQKQINKLTEDTRAAGSAGVGAGGGQGIAYLQTSNLREQARINKEIINLTTDHNILQKRNLSLTENITKQIEKGAVLTDDVKTKKEKVQKVDTSAIDTQKANVAAARDAQKAIVDDDKASYAERFAALANYSNLSIQINNLTEQEKIKKAKGSAGLMLSAAAEAAQANQKVDIEVNKKRVALTDEANKDILDKFTKQEQDEILAIRDGNSEKLQLIEQYRAEASQGLAEQYAAGIITKKQYEKQLLDIDNQAAADSIQVQIDALKAVIEKEKNYLGAGIGTNKALADDEKKLAALQIDLSKKTTDAKINELNKQKDAQKQYKDALIQLGQEVFNFGVTLGNATYERRLNQIQDEMDAADKKKQFDIDQVNDSVGTEAEKADKIAIINARAASQQEVLEKKKRDEQLRQAKFQKAANLFQIAGNTAVAVMKTYAEFGFPLGLPLAIAQAAIGAVQIATVLATPLPKYFTGTDNSKAGLAWTDELGPELYIEPDGNTFIGGSKPNIKNLKGGTQIIPHDELVRMVAKPDVLFNQQTKIDLSPLQSTISEGNNKIIRAINSKQTVFKGSKRGFLADSERISSMNDYIKRNF